jgi:hypothetical protein
MTGPLCERILFSLIVIAPIVNGMDSASSTGDVIQNAFDNVRRDSEFAHPARTRSSQIVMSPSLKIVAQFDDAPVKLLLASRPVVSPKNKLAIARTAVVENVLYWAAERNRMFAVIFTSCWRQHDCVTDNFTPLQAANFIQSLSGQHQNANDVRIIVIAKCGPNYF